MLFDAYRREAEAFVAEIGLEHYLHFAGLKPSLDIEPVYRDHSTLFSPDAVHGLQVVDNAPLLQFSVEGLVGRSTTRETAAIADREAALELTVDGHTIPFRRAPIEQGDARDKERRAVIEAARLEAIERELNPLHERVLERTHALARELGWPSTTAMCSDVSGIDLHELARRAGRLLAATEDEYKRVVMPLMRAEVGVDRLRRADLPAFFRAPSLDEHFPAGPLVETLANTLSDLGIDAWERVKLDAETRPTKSPRAFCAAVRVPHEVYLVISPHGGRDDYETILHEAGHSQHFAHVAPALDFERRHLGDNSITEAYAFLLQRLAAEPAWLVRHLDATGTSAVVRHSRAAKLVLLRRYAAKLAYEVELHDNPSTSSASLRRTYARRLSDALHVDWPEATWLSDVDPFFYAARYLRAWALEAELAAELGEDHGPEWFTAPEAGARLLELWAEGQPANARELLGHEPDFEALTAELLQAA